MSNLLPKKNNLFENPVLSLYNRYDKKYAGYNDGKENSGYQGELG